MWETELGARGAGLFPGRFDEEAPSWSHCLRRDTVAIRTPKLETVACSGSTLSISSPRTPRNPERAAKVSEEGRPSATWE